MRDKGWQRAEDRFGIIMPLFAISFPKRESGGEEGGDLRRVEMSRADHAQTTLCANEKPTDPVENSGGIVGRRIDIRLLISWSERFSKWKRNLC